MTEQVTEPVDQVRAIVELQYGRSAEFKVEVHDKVVTLHVPERSKFDISWMTAKPRVIDRIRTYVHPHSVRVVEEYVTPVEEKPAEKAAEKAVEKADGDAPEKKGEAAPAGTQRPRIQAKPVPLKAEAPVKPAEGSE